MASARLWLELSQLFLKHLLCFSFSLNVLLFLTVSELLLVHVLPFLGVAAWN